MHILKYGLTNFNTTISRKRLRERAITLFPTHQDTIDFDKNYEKNRQERARYKGTIRGHAQGHTQRFVDEGAREQGFDWEQRLEPRSLSRSVPVDEFVYEGRAEHVTVDEVPEVGPNLTER